MNRNPKVLFYSGGFSPVGGIETFLHDLLLGLNERGLLAQLVCWGAKGELLSDLEQRGFRVHRQRWRWGCRWKWPDRLLLLRGIRAARQADVVLFGKVLETRTQRALARDKFPEGRPRFILVTPYRPSEMWAAGVPPQDVLNCFDTIVVQGASFETELRGYSYRGDVRVLPYLPPLCGDPTPFPSPSVTRVGYLGRLAAQKNLAYLVQAFCVARRNGLDAELHIFGAGPERGALQARAEQMGVSHLVCFHGSKAHREVPAAIDSCHMFAFTSISEGQCLAALEILARGRPVVATPVGAFPEFLSDGLLGTLAAPDQPEEFARSLVTVARQIRENTFTPNGVQAAYRKRFPREQVIQGYVDLISECERPE